jgi:hypothetical protein
MVAGASGVHAAPSFARAPVADVGWSRLSAQRPMAARAWPGWLCMAKVPRAACLLFQLPQGQPNVNVPSLAACHHASSRSLPEKLNPPQNGHKGTQAAWPSRNSNISSADGCRCCHAPYSAYMLHWPFAQRQPSHR